MAAEYLANAVQSVSLNNPVVFTASIPCSRGLVYHEDETGTFILRGRVCNPCAKAASYRVTFNGNIALPEGATVTPIAVAIAVNGEPRPASRAISTPTAVEAYDEVTSTTIIQVPRGCCFTISVRAVPASEDTTVTPAPVINVQNASFVITSADA